MDIYSELCTEVYELTKPVGHSFGDVEYYLERLKSCQGRILEPAVGTGRILIPLLEAGLLVDGIDNSTQMLDVCRAHMRERGLDTNLYEGDMREFSLPNRYEAVILPGASLLLIEKREDSLRALKCFYEHLQPGGRILLDTFLQPDVALHEVNTSSWTTPEGDLITMERKTVEVDHLNQYSVAFLKYEKWRAGRLIQTELQRFPLRWYGVEEFKLVLEQVGFVDIVVSADYEYGRAPSDAKQMFTYEARRP